MSKVLVIPDVHLKPWMFEEASKLFETGAFDAAVMLGDLADDWGQQSNLALYEETYRAAADFAKRFPNTYWCYGNHDVSYLWKKYESGYSYEAERTVVELTKALKNALPVSHCAFLHQFDNVVFSHAGLTEDFVRRCYFNQKPSLSMILKTVDRMSSYELWNDDSPIWARPQYGREQLYVPRGILQVVGHTPVAAPLDEGDLLTLDTFSTMPDGDPIGDEQFVFVDTEAKTWDYAE